jgi:glucose/arabinose dehydrogenase
VGAEARFMALDDNGILYVSQPTAGRIVSLKDDGTGKYALIGPIVEGKPTIHGMFFKDGWLWFTQSKAVYKVKLTKEGKADGDPVTILSDLPGVERADGGHWWRSILVVADGFFTGVGDPQNASDQTGTDRSKIWKYSLDGKTRELWCSGVRNTEKLQLRPGTDELWGCDHGSDNFGSNFKEAAGTNQPVTNNYPPDEFNHYVKDGFYGHPFIVGAGLPRPEYASRPDILAIAANTIDPAWLVGPHYANNGWTFVTKDSGVAHKGDVLIACHGSWNATTKEGYRIQKVLFDQQTGQPYGAIQLVGTLSPDRKNTIGRPVDVQEMPDGSFLFSDDQNNRIWRLAAIKGQTEPK